VNYWLALRELFVCVVVIIFIGVTIGFMIMRGEYQGNTNEEVYGVTQAQEHPSLILVQKFSSKDTQ